MWPLRDDETRPGGRNRSSARGQAGGLMATGTAPAGATTGSALRGRDFRLLWTAESISKTGSAVTTFALPLVALQRLGATTLMMGVLNALIWLPWLLVGLQAGAWA